MRPVLLTKHELLDPLRRAQGKLRLIEERGAQHSSDEIISEGLFVLALSVAEVVLTDLLATLYRRIPGKLPEKEFTIMKTDFLDREFSLLDSQIERSLITLGYKSLSDVIDFTADRLGCDLSRFAITHGSELKEMKESRNLLLHNDLTVNATYIARAGTAARSTVIGDRIPINHSYFMKTLIVLRAFVDSLEKEVGAKYAEYTRAAAIRRLWEYVFSSPILSFDKYWSVDEDVDEVQLKTLSFSPLISTSETMFLGVWLAHYSGESSHLKRLNMGSLDDERQDRMLWLLWVFRNFRLD